MEERRKTNAKFTAAGFGAAYFSVAIISILLVSVLFAFAVLTAAGGSSEAKKIAEKDWYKFLSYLLTPAAIAVSGLIFVKSFGEEITEVCRMKKADGKSCLLALLLTAGMFFGLSPLNGFFIEFLTKYAGYNYVAPSLPSFSAVNIVLTVITVCVIPAFFEELFFRGILTYSLSGTGLFAASLISGLYFSLFHMNPAQTPYQFVVGVLFGLLAIKSGSVFPGIAAHFLNNFIILILHYACPSFDGFTGTWLIITVIFGLLCLAAFLFFTVKKDKNEEERKYKYDYKTFFLYSAIGVAACVMMWISGLVAA